MGRVNIPIMLSSLALSVVFWFIAYGEGVIENQRMPVLLTDKNISGLPPDLFVDRQDSDEDIGRVIINFMGPKVSVENAMSSLNPDRDLSVDLFNATDGTARYPIKLTPSLAALVPSPPQVTLTLEKIIQKKVLIVVKGIRALRDNAQSLTSEEPSAREATIRGPERIVQQIREARANLDLSVINPDNVQPQDDVPVIPIGDKGQEFTKYIVIRPSTISITPIISATSSKKQVLVSPIFEGVPAKGFVYNGYSVNPYQVWLIGDNLQLAKTTEVQTEKIDVNGLTSSKTIRVKLQPLPGVAFEPNWVKVTYNVAPDSQFHVTPSVPAPSNAAPPTSTTGSNSPP